MLTTLYRQHNEYVLVLKQKQEKKKKELITAADQLTRVVLDGLNNDVAECYKNQKRIDQACKQLTTQSNLLIKQSQAWITLLGQFTDALKELGDVENYSKIIERECTTITNTLATVHQDMMKNRQAANNPSSTSATPANNPPSIPATPANNPLSIPAVSANNPPFIPATPDNNPPSTSAASANDAPFTPATPAPESSD